MHRRGWLARPIRRHWQHKCGFQFRCEYGSSAFKYTLTIAGNTLTVIQSGATNFLSTNSLTVGPQPGSNSVMLTQIPQITIGPAPANDSWLRLAPGYRTMQESGCCVFTFDLNPGAMIE